MSVMITVRATLLIGMASLLVTGCSSQAPGSSAAPPLVVCGTTLWSGPSGAVTADATASRVLITNASSGGEIFLRFTNECQDGVVLIVAPSQGKIITGAHSSDGRLAAAAIRPLVSTFEATAQHRDGTTTTISVRLQP
jgi:hypothetical protein